MIFSFSIALILAGQSGVNDLHSNIDKCWQQYMRSADSDISLEVNTVEISEFEETTNIAFMEGNSGAIGERDDNYRIHLLCTVINDTQDIIHLGYPLNKSYISKDVPERNEYIENYIGDDNKFFNVILFSYIGRGQVTYLNEKQYTNTQLYERLRTFSRPILERESLPGEELFAQWIQPEFWDTYQEQECWLSVSFYQRDGYRVMNDCYGEYPYHDVESGQWTIDGDKLILHNRSFRSGYSFLSEDHVFEVAYEISGNELHIFVDGRESGALVLKKWKP